MVDNGSAYRAATLQGICARLDIRLIYCRPYAPEGKGKLERWHRTFRNQFLSELDISRINDLDDLNARLWAWIEQVYHRTAHSSLDDKTPLAHFQQDLPKLRQLGQKAAQLDAIFYHRVPRKVRKDGSVSYQGRDFEVPYELSGKSVRLFLLLFVHLLTVPISVNDMRLGNYLAIIAFLGIVSVALVTLAPRIPFLGSITGGTYEGWKRLHRFIGIFFILGFIHSLTVKALDALVAITWVQMFFIFGTLSYLYTEIFGRFFKKYLPYTVEAVRHPNPSTTEVSLRPKKQPIHRQRAGQFLFVRFLGDRLLNEPHPFTISSAPHEDVLRVTVKASGDFTRALFADLKPGMDAVVEGA